MVDCSKESTEAAPGSPAPIAEDEVIFRVIPSTFVDANNGVDPSFYSTVFDPDAMSTLRLAYADSLQVKATLDEIFPGRNEEELNALCNAYVRANVFELKATAHKHFPALAKSLDDRRVFCIHDTPILPLRPSHADVELAPSWKREASEEWPISKNKIKKRLREIFGRPIPLPIEAS